MDFPRIRAYLDNSSPEKILCALVGVGLLIFTSYRLDSCLPDIAHRCEFWLRRYRAYGHLAFFLLWIQWLVALGFLVAGLIPWKSERMSDSDSDGH